MRVTEVVEMAAELAVTEVVLLQMGVVLEGDTRALQPLLRIQPVEDIVQMKVVLLLLQQTRLAL
jgi:hypothetical protein